jgi:signal transduction histidine kinase
LIINLVEAMSGLGERPRELLISTAKAEPAGVVVEVCDSGPGLTPTYLERVFDAFSQAHWFGHGTIDLPLNYRSAWGRLWATASQPQGATDLHPT